MIENSNTPTTRRALVARPTAALLALALAASTAHAADPGPTCEASKLGTSAKYASCRLKADSKAARAGTSADYSKCNLDKFASAEDKAGMGVCPTEGDQATVQGYLDDCTSTAALWLAGGGGLPDTCDSDLVACEGDLSTTNADLTTCEGTLGTCNTNLTTCSGNLGTCSTNLTTCSGDLSTTNADLTSCEGDLSTTNADLTACEGDLSTTNADLTACEGDLSTTNADLTTCEGDLAACESAPAGVPKTGQTTSYGAGSDGAEQRGTARSFTDNGDGTITDNVTGLMWEKKSDDGSIHDKDNTYSWSTGTNNMDGTMVTTFLATLNGGGGFAGYNDWRIPNLFELESLRNMEASNPAVYPAFHNACTGGCTVTTCSCTRSLGHWSSTTIQGAPYGAWNVYFSFGFMSNDDKTFGFYVRAVRAGS